MVKAWYMNEDLDNPTLEHHLDPPKYVDVKDLYEITGVQYIQLNLETYNTDGHLDKIRKSSNYSYEDEITCSKATMPCFEEQQKKFFEEHLHTDEEVRFVVDGSGYFDVRDKEDKWIRINVVAGDMIILPSGIYHRFTLDEKKYIKAKRYFNGPPCWIPYNRPVDDMECRKEYLEKLTKGF